MRFLRRIACLFKACPGRIDHDKHSVYWECVICGKKDRAEPCGDHWKPFPPSVPQVPPTWSRKST